MRSNSTTTNGKQLEQLAALQTINQLVAAGGTTESIMQTALNLILDRLDKPKSLIRHVTDRPGHDRRYAIDAGRIINELDWRPSVSFEQGLEKTIDWYVQNQKWLTNVVSGDYQQYYDTMYSNR